MNVQSPKSFQLSRPATCSDAEWDQRVKLAAAYRLVDHFGEHTLEALQGGSATLQAVPGIGPKRALVLAEAFAEGRDRHRVLAELRGLGLRPAQAQKLYERWGPAAIERVRADPYALIGSLRGIGFETAERIAGQLGIPIDSVVRGRGVILHRLREALGEGHTWLPEAELEQRLGGRGLAEQTITTALAELIQEEKLACEIDGAGAVSTEAATRRRPGMMMMQEVERKRTTMM